MCSFSGDCFVLFEIVLRAWEIREILLGLLSLGTTSGIRASKFRMGFLKIRRARDLIRWRSCVDLKSEVLVFVGSCVDLRRTQGGLVESVVE